jgi:hypothetical protein
MKQKRTMTKKDLFEALAGVPEDAEIVSGSPLLKAFCPIKKVFCTSEEATRNWSFCEPENTELAVLEIEL